MISRAFERRWVAGQYGRQNDIVDVHVEQSVQTRYIPSAGVAAIWRCKPDNIRRGENVLSPHRFPTIRIM